MKKYIIYLVLTGLLIFNFLLWSERSKSESKQGTVNQDFVENFNNYKALQQENVGQGVLNNDISIDKATTATDIKGNKILLTDIIAHGKKLIIRNTETGCGLCIESELQVIKKFEKKIGVGNIIMLTTHNSVRKLEVFKKTNDFDFQIYSCPKLDFPFEKDKPYLFLLDSTMIVKNFFIPEPTHPGLSGAYYSAITKRYFANKNTFVTLNN